MTTNTEKLKRVLDILVNAKEQITKELEGTPFTHLLIKSKSSIDQLTNTIRHTTGVSVSQESIPQFEPLTEVMGEKVEAAKSISPEEIVVTEDDMTIFKGKVEKLYADLPGMDNDSVLRTYINEPDVIRGVAKKAGVENFQEADLTIEFLDEIRKAMADKEARDKMLEEHKNGKEESPLIQKLQEASDKAELAEKNHLAATQKLDNLKKSNASTSKINKAANAVTAAEKAKQDAYDLVALIQKQIEEEVGQPSQE